MTCQIECIIYDELLDYMRQQANDTFPQLNDEEVLQNFASKLYTHAEFCICRNNGMPVGMIAFYANGKGAEFAYIPHVYVSPEHRKHGLFKHMLNSVILYVRDRGFTELRLEVEKENKLAQNAYMRNGFQYLSDNISSKSIYMNKHI